MEMSLSAAARASGLSKSTLSRAIKSGRLSARRAEGGSGWVVDAAELFRAYPAAAARPDAPHDEAAPALWRATQPPDAGHDEARGAVALLEQALAYERAALEREREVTADLRQRLDRSDERVRALLGQGTPAPSPAPAPVRGLLARLLGR
jgi:hypothetical protein